MKNFLAIALLCLTGCSQQSWWDRLASRQEQLLVIDIAEQLRAGNVDKLAQVSEPELKQQLPAYVTQVSPMLFKVNGKFSLQTVNVFELHGGPTTKTFVVQGGSEGHWAIVRIVLQGYENPLPLAGLNVLPFTSDPSTLNDFEIGNRGALGYLWIATMVTCACICIWATFLIWRTRWLKRRWLWTIGSLVGFFGFGLNWSTGAWAILFVNVSILGAQATKSGPYSPWLLSFGVPLIALLVIFRWYRCQNQVQAAENSLP